MRLRHTGLFALIRITRGDRIFHPIEEGQCASSGMVGLLTFRRPRDAIDEINERGLDMRELSPKLISLAELAKAYLGLPKELVEMLSPSNNRA